MKYIITILLATLIASQVSSAVITKVTVTVEPNEVNQCVELLKDYGYIKN